MFETITGEAEDSYSVAMDDIKILPGACKPPGSCSFEDDLCGWVNSRGEGEKLTILFWFICFCLKIIRFGNAKASEKETKQ